MKSAFLGIDPGSASGALAMIDKKGRPLFCEDCNGTPSEVTQKAFEILEPFSEDYEIILAVIEKIHSMPKQGIVSSFKFGMNFGLWQGLFLGASIPLELVSPQSWQKDILARSGTKKAGALEYCRQKYPQLSWKRKKDHNRADALLLAEWGRLRTLLQLS